MRRLLLAAALPLLTAAACSGRRGPGTSPFPTGGHFRAERVARRTTVLIDAPGWATSCPAESLIVVIALGGAWNGGIAVHGGAPGGARDYEVRPSLGEVGTATAGFRVPATGTARLGVGGTIQLAIGDAASGRFDIVLPDSAGEHVVIRGTLTGIPVTVLSSATCNPP